MPDGPESFEPVGLDIVGGVNLDSPVLICGVSVGP
jgi:hypothetical protein